MRGNQTGYLQLLLLVLLLAVAVAGFAAYRVHSVEHQASVASKSVVSTAPAAVASPLTTASQQLDQTDAQLTTTLDDSALDSDLSSM